QLSDTGTLSDLSKLQSNLNVLYERRGEESNFLKSLTDLEREINRYVEKLNSLKEPFDVYIEDFVNNITIFNKNFSTFSKLLYEEEFILSYEYSNDRFKFFIENVASNEG